MRYDFDLWTATTVDECSVLEPALKNFGQASARRGWTRREDDVLYRRCAKLKHADTARCKGYDAGKKVSGIKRHLAVDTNGLPHAIEVTTADVNDREGGVLLLLRDAETLSDVVQVLVGSGGTGERFAQHVRALLGATTEVAMRSELHKFAVMPKRWVVERSFSWLENAVDCGRTASGTCIQVNR